MPCALLQGWRARGTQQSQREELEEGGTYRYLGMQQRFGANPNRTKQGVMKEYIGRTRRVWESGLNMGMKTQAQNSWATATMRYSLGTIGWCRSDVQEMDRVTRKVMRQNKAHQYGASVARLYQPRVNGGKGLVSLELAWETETVASVLYLHTNQEVIEAEAWTKLLALHADMDISSPGPSLSSIEPQSPQEILGPNLHN